MKRVLPALALLLTCPAGHAVAHRFSANTFGANGNGVTVNTKAIQAALDAAALTGHGIVTLAPGTYLTGALFIKSGTELHLDRGVTLQGVSTLDGYPVLPTRVAGIEMPWPAALVNVYEQHDASITGEGTIDGNGKLWWDRYWALRRQYEARGLRWAADYDAQRPRLIQIYKSTRVKLAGPLLTRSGFWTIDICYSDHVLVDGVTIRNNVGGRGPSTDGIDIDSSKHILVEHADVSVNDDALCLKAGRDADGLRVAKPDEDIVVRDSTVRDGAAAITIGSETSGGFRHINVYHIRAFGHVASGVLFKSAHTRGGWADDVRIHNLTLENVAIPIHIEMNWNPSYSYAVIPPGLKNYPDYYKVLATPVPAARGLARFHNVRIWNVKATGAKRAFDVSASDEAPLTDFTLNDIEIAAQTAGTVADVKNWTLTDVKLDNADGSTLTPASDTGWFVDHCSGVATVSYKYPPQ